MSGSGCVPAAMHACGMVSRRAFLNYLYWAVQFRADRDQFLHRSSSRINQEAVARGLGIAGSQITRLIVGEQEITLRLLVALQRFSEAKDLPDLIARISVAPPCPEDAYRQKIVE